MNTRRLGCLNTSGNIVVIVILLVVGGVGFTRGNVLFSPGKLNAQSTGVTLGGVRSHAQLNNRCSACHANPFTSQRMANRCVSCHTDLESDSQNFHKAMVKQGMDQGCFQCHTDHNGPLASMTVFDDSKFPHKGLGYSLEGHRRNANGSGFACSDCHPSGVTRFEKTVCQDCHQKINASFIQGHLQAFGTDCLNCHDGIDTYGPQFDHNRVAFVLKGKHAAAACLSCHSGEGSIKLLQATPQNCDACHRKDDIHQGRLGSVCSKCHNADGWADATFDHALAAFPLVGKHQTVACEKCHVQDASGATVFKGTPMDCHSCHAKEDPHNGQFGQDCSACHSPVDWKSVTFDHSKSNFPLVGSHETVACDQCHINGVFKGTPTGCYACHAKDDHHNGQFGQDCGACHTPDSWANATFDHSKSAFPLTGAHQSLQCTQCHVNNVFQGTPTACVGCHVEPGYHLGLFGTDCVACHNTSGWSPAKFSGPHPFPMKHGGASDCRSCHPSVLMRYTCYTCHNQASTAASHRNEGIGNIQNCIQCHPTGGGGG